MYKKEQTKGKGRPKSFCNSDIIEKAMRLFWQKGYKNLSFNEIAHETGLTRASLYNAFETKENLFEKAIEKYIFTRGLTNNLDLEEVQSVQTLLTQMFYEMAEFFPYVENNRGCFVINSVCEKIHDDDRVGSFLKAIYAAGINLIRELVLKAVSQGELKEDTDVDTITNIIIAFMNGITIISKTGITEADLKKMAESFLTQIGFNNTSEL